MDWKVWYRVEAESEAGRTAVEAAVAQWSGGDPGIGATLARGGVASFPHTTLRDSAMPLARVATSVVEGGFDRVVALGVLHSSSLPEPERGLVPAAISGDPAALSRVGGAFVAEGDSVTPFGVVRAGPAPAAGPWARRDGCLVENEFSLDLFLAVLARAAKARGTEAPPVTRLFVGPTVVEGAGGTMAGTVARALRPLLGPRVALVATGDLIHAGHGYSTPEEVAALPADAALLVRQFDATCRQMLEAEFVGEGRVADAIARGIRCDQRHVLPVLAALLGRGATARIVSFGLTDYGAILGQAPPCVVASALWTADPAGAGTLDAP